MAARIVSIVHHHAAAAPTALAVPAGVPERQPAQWPAGAAGSEHVWRGASGRLYAHSVYTLIECPPLPPIGYVLARRDADGRLTPLRIGVGTSDAPTLNLAEVRRLGALAGANEVHVRLDAATDAERRLAACDLRAGLLGTLAAAPASGPATGT